MTIKTIKAPDYYRKIWKVGDHIIDLIVEGYGFEPEDLTIEIMIDSDTSEKIDDEYTYKITRSIFREFEEFRKTPGFEGRTIVLYPEHGEHLRHFKKLGFKLLERPEKDYSHLEYAKYYYITL